MLIAPLDWGLGHATRCIPIIKELVGRNCEVWIAASGDQKILLRKEFPFLDFIELDGYNMYYGKNRALTLFKLFSSIPKILTRIKTENRWLSQFIRLRRPDLIISDNRYGLHAPGIPSIFITHQLSIRTGMGQFFDNMLRRLNYRFIERFTACWIPDLPVGEGLAGSLSHPPAMPKIPTRYLGPLSRMTQAPDAIKKTPDPDLLILLSGPEPQRTILENILFDQLKTSPDHAGHTSQPKPNLITLVRGLPSNASTPPTIPNTRIFNHLPAADLAPLLTAASLILTRAGYSTIMDLASLDKKAILIPTPGQTEQEYLGASLHSRRHALCIPQKDFSLQDALAKAKAFPFTPFNTNGNGKNTLLITAIEDMLNWVQEKSPHHSPGTADFV